MGPHCILRRFWVPGFEFRRLDRGQALIYAPSDGQPRTPSACQFESDARTLFRSDDLAGYSHAHHAIDMWAGMHWPTLLLPSRCRSLAGLAYVDDAGPRQSDTFFKWYTPTNWMGGGTQVHRQIVLGGSPFLKIIVVTVKIMQLS